MFDYICFRFVRANHQMTMQNTAPVTLFDATVMEDSTIAAVAKVSDGTEGEAILSADVTSGDFPVPDGTNVNIASIVNQVVQIFFIVIILFANGLILAAIRQSKKLQKLTFYLLGGVAVGDALFAFAFASKFILKDKWNGYGCMLCCFFVLVSSLSSFSCVLFTTIQNFISVKFYAYAKNGLSNRSAKLLVAGIWVFWSIVGSTGFITADVTKENPGNLCFIGNALYSSSFLLMLSVIALAKFVFVIVLQVYTILIVKQQHSHIQSQLNTNVAANVVKVRNIQRVARVTKIITLVLLLTLFSWGPLLVAFAVISVCPETCGVTGEHILILASLLFINSFGNVFIYGMKSEEFREVSGKCSDTRLK